MILLSFCGFLRYDEISSLRCNDVQIFYSYFILKINKSKTDQYRQGNEVPISKGTTIDCVAGRMWSDPFFLRGVRGIKSPQHNIELMVLPFYLWYSLTPVASNAL